MLDDGLVKLLAQSLDNDEPHPEGLRLAAVAIILGGHGSSALMIKRAEHDGDPWSGQIAFPGGKMQAGDASARATAVRETIEEVGIDLDATARFLGYAAALTTHTGTISVVPAVFQLVTDVDVRTNEEVASYKWVDLPRLVGPESRSKYQLNNGDGSLEVPAFKTDDYVVWGLTYRIISSLMRTGEP